MALHILKGNGRALDHDVVRFALAYTPCLLVDCADAADPYQHPDTDVATFLAVHVVQAELLYRLRDILRALPQTVRRLGVKRVVITQFTRLFHYHDEAENADIYEEVWRRIGEAAKELDVVVGVPEGSVHEAYAERLGGLRWDTRSAANDTSPTSSSKSSRPMGAACDRMSASCMSVLSSRR